MFFGGTTCPVDLGLTGHETTPSCDVLLIYRESAETERVASSLRERNFDVDIADHDAALPRLQESPARIVVTDWLLDSVPSMDLLRFLEHARRRSVLIRRLPRSTYRLERVADEIAAAWSAGR